ncbi:MAG: hypothetical protein ABJB34_12465, partial [Acidobacteriota bacterium]
MKRKTGKNRAQLNPVEKRFWLSGCTAGSETVFMDCKLFISPPCKFPLTDSIDRSVFANRQSKVVGAQAVFAGLRFARSVFRFASAV